jgi:membrane protease YdiL (CAAX protease family)
LVAGAIGLPTALLEFPSFPASLAGIGWKLGTVAVMLLAIRTFERRRPTAEAVGLKPVRSPVRTDRTVVAVVGIIAMVVVSASWDRIPGLRELDAAGSASSYGSTGRITTALLLFELLVRYPITVLAEESFFRGFIQPRLTLAAPVVGGLLFAAYHLQQWQTIPSLVPFGIALGLLRWWLGNIWPGAVLHYAGNAMFILSLR